MAAKKGDPLIPVDLHCILGSLRQSCLFKKREGNETDFEKTSSPFSLLCHIGGKILYV